MKEPPFFMQPILHSIESVVLDIWDEFDSLTDKDVVWVYDQLKNFYKKKAAAKNPKEPLSTFEKRQALIDEILNILDEREEMNADKPVVNNPDYRIGDHLISSPAVLYQAGFNRLSKSVVFWSKERGAQGYLSFIKNQVI